MFASLTFSRLWAAPLAVVLISCSTLSAQEKKNPWEGLKYQSAAKCSECHSLPKGNQLPSEDPNVKEPRAWDVVLLTEFSVWKTHDKHAQAYAVLVGPRGKRMGEILGQDVTKRETGCITCHAMANLGPYEAGGIDKLDGVSCGGCHGPSSNWMGPHAELSWREKSPKEKFALGLRDLRDAEVRSALCVSCHIGNADQGKIVTHAMFAAGHPPLPPIEIASFSKNQPQHWRDPKQVPYFKNATAKIKANYHLEEVELFQTKLALTGALVALRETVKLAADRADFQSPRPTELWPELFMDGKAPANKDAIANLARNSWPEIAMAHDDCFACHHDLKYPGFRQVRGFGFHLPGKEPMRVSPGRPILRAWPTALVLAALLAAEVPSTEMEEGLKDLLAACNERPFGSPALIRNAGIKVAQACDTALAALKTKKIDSAAGRKLTIELLKLYTQPGPNGKVVIPDYESARQVGAFLEVALDDLGHSKAKLPKGMDELVKILNLHPYQNRMARVKEVLAALGRAADNPMADFKDDFFAYLGDISSVSLLRKLEKNPNFLITMIRLDNSRFNQEMIKSPLVDTLQKLDDDENVISLKSIADYDPEVFRKTLEQIADELKAP
ncbi:MAG: hypothetical protein EXR99_08960 [Gemmataceae bacterium]|nr:hypothetical protein [Gemmataceae bacterium]